LVGDLMAHTISPLAGRLMTPGAIKASFHPAPVSDKFESFPLQMTFRPSQIRATAADTAMMVPAAIELSERYAEIDVRVIAMAGEGDLIAHKDKHSERLVAELKNGELRVVPGQGHLFHYAVPGEVVDAINEVRSERPNSNRAAALRHRVSVRGSMEFTMTEAEAEKEAESGKVPMPASGQTSPKLRSDGVSDAGTHGKSGGSESAGGAYPNPHTGKEERGESGGFGGGQSEAGYYGGGKLDGEEAPHEETTPIDKGRGASG
jgi:hypothetical protein